MLSRVFPLATVLGIACALPPAPLPRAEFIVATSDSAFWVKTNAQGVQVRGVPMTLARYGGRFHEVYVANLDRSYTDAVFTGERLFARDLMTNDSTMVYEDTIIAHLAARYAKVNPRARRLGPSDDTPDNASITATGETDILDVRGPYVLFEHRSKIQDGDDERDDTTRSAIDLRSGRTMFAEVLARDSIAQDHAVVLAAPHQWHRAGYDVLVRGDAGQGTMSFLLSDARKQLWRLITVEGRPRLYWLDAPPVDAQTRQALTRAFDGAAMYDETIKYVRYTPPRRTLLVRYATFHHSR